MTLAVTDYETLALHDRARAHEHRLLLGARGARIPRSRRASSTAFRRGLDIAGHVSWVPGGTRAQLGPPRSHVPGRCRPRARAEGPPRRTARTSICHTGDAGWISGQALNGFNAAAVHRAPITFVMHRNGIQLSGTTAEHHEPGSAADRRELRHQRSSRSVAARSARAVRRLPRSVHAMRRRAARR